MDQALKQRLIGAVVIVSLIVIFVPMLFDEAPESGASSTIEIPALPEAVEEKSLNLPGSAAEVAAPPETKPAAENEYKIIPLDDPPPKAAAADAPPPAEVSVAQGPATEPSAAEEEVWEPVGDEAAHAAADPAVRETAAPESEATEAPVKPGLKEKGAESAAKRAKAAADKKAPLAGEGGAPAKATVPGRTAPAKSEASAKQAPSAKATAPRNSADGAAKPAAAKDSAPPAAWVVQTGSFTGESNARLLVERLRKAKFPAFVETVKGESGPVYRVHVGPELNRSRAEQVQKQIESTIGVKGLILSHD